MEDMTYAQSVGEQPMSDGYAFFPEDLMEDMGAGDYDPEEMSAVIGMVGDRDTAARIRQLSEENARLREILFSGGNGWDAV
jgi:hypothetical protein